MMILADTSVWIDHLRSGNQLTEILGQQSALIHPFIAGELACGTLKNRSIFLQNLNLLPLAPLASHEEVLRLLEHHRLWGRGIGWIDAHLLSSALLAKCQFWTLDTKLAQVAQIAGVPCYSANKPN